MAEVNAVFRERSDGDYDFVLALGVKEDCEMAEVILETVEQTISEFGDDIIMVRFDDLKHVPDVLSAETGQSVEVSNVKG